MKDGPYIRNDAARAALFELHQAQAEYNRKMFEVTLTCKHSVCYETPYVSGTYGSLEEMRTCVDCGLTEIRHSLFQFQLVRSEFSKRVSREELYDLRRGQLNADQQEALYDKKATLAEVLKDLYPHTSVAQSAAA